MIGEMKDGGSEAKLVVRGTVDGKPSEMTWAIKAEPENPDFGFLGLVLQDAKKNGGLMMPTPGSDALRELGAMLTHSAADLVRSGRMALQSGDLKAAADIANEALRRDPNSVDASSLRDAIRQRKDQSSVRAKSPFRLVSFGGQPPQGDVFGSAAPAQIPTQGLAVPASDVFVPNAPISQGIDELSTAGDLLAAEEEMRRVDAQRIEAEVQNDLRETRSLVQRDPAAAIARLKSRQSEVRLAPGLDAGKRNQLLSLLASGLQTAARRDAEIKATTAQAERAQAAANAASRLIADQRPTRFFGSATGSTIQCTHGSTSVS